MSKRAHRHHCKNEKYCDCGKPALYYSRTRRAVRRQRDHSLCFRCFRSETDRVHARSQVRR